MRHQLPACIHSTSLLLSNYMDIASLTSADLRDLTRLVEKKEQLLARVAKIDTDLAAAGMAAPATAAPRPPAAAAKRKRRTRQTASAAPKPLPPTPAAKPAGRSPRGSFKAAIIQLLKGAGEAGLGATEIAAKLGANPKSTYVWFFKTGRNVPEIKRIGPARYVWSAGSA